MSQQSPAATVDELDELLEPPAAAPLLGLNVKTLANLRCLGGGPEFIRVGRGRGAIRYSRRAIAAYREARRRTSTSQEAPA
jgi:hypothetical protein